MEYYVFSIVVHSNTSCSRYIGKAISNHKVSQIIVNAHHFCFPNEWLAVPNVYLVFKHVVPLYSFRAT
jgi:hypothetical protein